MILKWLSYFYPTACPLFTLSRYYNKIDLTRKPFKTHENIIRVPFDENIRANICRSLVIKKPPPYAKNISPPSVENVEILRFRVWNEKGSNISIELINFEHYFIDYFDFFTREI